MEKLLNKLRVLLVCASCHSIRTRLISTGPRHGCRLRNYSSENITRICPTSVPTAKSITADRFGVIRFKFMLTSLIIVIKVCLLVPGIKRHFSTNVAFCEAIGLNYCYWYRFALWMKTRYAKSLQCNFVKVLSSIFIFYSFVPAEQLHWIICHEPISRINTNVPEWAKYAVWNNQICNHGIHYVSHAFTGGVYWGMF